VRGKDHAGVGLQRGEKIKRAAALKIKNPRLQWPANCAQEYGLAIVISYSSAAMDFFSPLAVRATAFFVGQSGGS
jgi:hypothetical protein